ncbi:MAG: hypothetical protein IK042_03000 [Bacteroidales bacterium]|nr:hypothetical protein [Bacteroidales bacterium]
MKKLETKNKEAIYLAPEISIVELSSEGIVCASGDVNPSDPFSGGTEESWPTFMF